MVRSLFRILALIRKELLTSLKDPRSLVTLLVPPILQCLIFGYAASHDLNSIPYALLDEDGSAASRELVADFDGTGIFWCQAVLEGPSEMAGWIDPRRVILVLHIGPGFERDLKAGGQAWLQLIADGRNSNTSGIALGYARAIVETYNKRLRSERATTGRVSAGYLASETRFWYNPNLETRWFMIPTLIGALTMMQTLLLAAMSVAREREQGTFDQLLVTPFRPWEIMAGKAVPAVIVGLVQATNVLLVAQFWFRIPFVGSFVALYCGLFLFILAAVGVGLFISSISPTMQQAMLYSFAIIMPFMLLSGFTAPVKNMPGFLQQVTLINPLRHAIELTQRIYLEGAGLAQVWHELAFLVAIAVVTLVVGAWMFRRRLA